MPFLKLSIKQRILKYTVMTQTHKLKLVNYYTHFVPLILTDELALGLGALLARPILKKDSRSFSFFCWFALAAAAALSTANLSALAQSRVCLSFFAFALSLASAAAFSALSFASTTALHELRPELSKLQPFQPTLELQQLPCQQQPFWL